MNNNPIDANWPLKKERRNTKVRQLFNAVRPVALHEDEKSRIRMTLNAFTLRYPIRDEAVERSAHDRTPFTLRFMRMMPALATLGIALLLGGGISASAESALPGDNLYTVKVAVNERIRGAFTPSLIGKTEWEMQLAMRRLDEAEQLAAAGKLTPAFRANLAANIDAYSNAIWERTAALSDQNQTLAALTLNARYEASLRAHQRVLLGLVGSAQAAEPVRQEISALASNVDARANDAAVRQNDGDAKILKSDEKTVAGYVKEAEAAAHSALLASTLAIENRKALLGSELSKAAQAKFQLASGDFETGTLAEKNKDYRTALIAFQSALQGAEEAKILVALQSNFDLILPTSNK